MVWASTRILRSNRTGNKADGTRDLDFEIPKLQFQPYVFRRETLDNLRLVVWSMYWFKNFGQFLLNPNAPGWCEIPGCHPVETNSHCPRPFYLLKPITYSPITYVLVINELCRERNDLLLFTSTPSPFQLLTRNRLSHNGGMKIPLLNGFTPNFFKGFKYRATYWQASSKPYFSQGTSHNEHFIQEWGWGHGACGKQHKSK